VKHFHCGFRVQQLNLQQNWLISFLLEKKKRNFVNQSNEGTVSLLYQGG
jgi:hypothetical protein